MNWAHVKILMWEHLRRTLVTVVPITLLLAGLDVGVQYLSLNMEEMLWDTPIFLVGFGLFANLLFQLVSNTNASNLEFSVNPYYLRLPVHTLLLSSVRLALGSITLIVATVFLYAVHFKLLIVQPQTTWFEWSVDLWFLLTMVVGVYALVQLIAWGTGQWTTIITLGLVFYASVGGYVSFESYGRHLGPVHFALSVVLLCACAIVGSVILRYARYGESLPVYGQVIAMMGWFFSRAEGLSRVETGTFGSRSDALLWLERRYMRNIFPRASFVFLIPVCAFILIDFSSWGIEDAGRGVIGAFLLAATFSGTIFTVIALRRHSSEAHAFVLTKPVSILDVANARIRSMTGQIFAPAIVLQLALIVLVVAQLVSEGSLPGLPMGGGQIDFFPGQLIYLYFMYLGVLILTWCALWCAITFPVCIWWFYLFIGFYFVMSEMKLLNGEFDLPDWAYQTILVFALLPIIIVWVRGVARSLVCTMGPVILVTPVVIVAVYSALELLTSSGPVSTFPYMIAAAATLPFALTPQFVEYQRHR